ncbi:phage tail tape measure protein [Paenibacillus sp.]|uniref:phage tail tape measure protein n=1 Tax=Paenibacillus sp. TaxID=58172 RepID=UPI002D4BF616|nr:phage tail tape measure protein [Paenibacillus sp.]HZG87307.1 phage tail tape measure protein [Paenibacillus sp.]
MSTGLLYEISAVDNFSKTFDELERKLGGLSGLAGGAKSAGAGLTAMGAGLAAGIGSAIAVGADFDKQMSGVQAISGATAEEFELLREQALQLGSSTSKSASESAVAMRELAAMGFDVNSIMGAMPGVIAASEASGADMAQVSEVMASTLNIFGKEASEATKVADILAQTANISAADITDMQYALKYAGPPAASLGVSLEELSASIGIMTNAGMQGEQAGTTLRSALLGLLSPSEENSKLMESLGVAITDNEGNFVGISNLIENLSTSMEGMTETQKAANLAQLVGKEAVSGMLSLMEAGPGQIDAMTESLRNSSGASAEVAAIMKDNFAGSIDELSGSIETLAIGISDALTPAVQFVTEKITGLVNWFNDLDPTTKTVIATVGALAAGFGLVAGPLLLLIGFIPQIVAGFGLVGTVLSGVALGPIALVVGAIAGIIAIIATLWNTNEDFRNGVIAIWDEIWGTLGPLLTDLRDAAVESFGAILSKAEEIWPLIKSAFLGTWESIWQTLEPALNVLTTVWGEVFRGIGGVLETVFKGMKDQIENFEKILKGVMEFIAGIFSGDWDRAWKGIQTIVEGVWDAISTHIRATVNVIIGLINTFIGAFNSIKISIPSVDIPLVGKVGGFTIGMPQIPKIPQLAIGTDMVKESGLSVIHKGEAVVPAKVARGGYSGSGGAGGAQIVINATYVDSQAVQRLALEVNRILGRLTPGTWT